MAGCCKIVGKAADLGSCDHICLLLLSSVSSLLGLLQLLLCSSNGISHLGRLTAGDALLQQAQAVLLHLQLLFQPVSAADSSLACDHRTCHAQDHATGTSPGLGCCSVVLAYCIACWMLVNASCFALLATAALCAQIIGYSCRVDCSAFGWPWYGNSLCNMTRQVSSVHDSNCIEGGIT